MHPQPPKESTKREADVVGDVNNVVGNSRNSYLLHVTDTRRDEQWLVDGGALLSILPPTPQQRRRGPTGTQLRAANGTDIRCYGTTTRTITFGGTDFTFDFAIADVKNRILGADFLASFYLAPNHRDALRSEEHTSELQSQFRSSYAVFCLKKKKTIFFDIYLFPIRSA